MIAAQVLVHLVAARLHHAAAHFAFLLVQQVVNVGVRAGEVVIVRHAGFVVVAVAGTAVRVPAGARQEDTLG